MYNAECLNLWLLNTDPRFSGTIIEDNKYRYLMCIREIDDAGNEVYPGYRMFKVYRIL